MNNLLVNLLQSVGLAWWIEITTELPHCTYYFGPFTSEQEARAEKRGYIEDLEQEGAQGIVVIIKRCKPDDLTIYEDDDEANRRDPSRLLSA
ncbi:DUF1816 domain-containing protein [Trichothermofontia sp.]